jgi:hypothetical protein
MNNVIGARAPAWFRIVGTLGLLWNLFGVYEYLMTVGLVGHAPAMAAMPAWVTGAFALATFGGALGSLGLLLLKSWSRLLLFLSLLAIIAMDIWTFALRADGTRLVGAELYITISVLVVGVLLAWCAQTAAKRGWLS